jgi:hypothetical protein
VVTDERTGEPLEGLRVSGNRSNGSARPLFSDSAVTDASGRFRLRLYIGTHDVRVLRPLPKSTGRTTVWSLASRPPYQVRLDLKAGETREIRFAIDPERLPDYRMIGPPRPDETPPAPE